MKGNKERKKMGRGAMRRAPSIYYLPATYSESAGHTPFY